MHFVRRAEATRDVTEIRPPIRNNSEVVSDPNFGPSLVMSSKSQKPGTCDEAGLGPNGLVDKL